MAGVGDDPRSDDANNRAYGALEKAMQARGFRTTRALTQALNESGYKVSERAVGAWRNREASMPAWALVAFSQVSGLSLDALVGEAEVESLAHAVARHERMLGDMQAITADLSREPAAGKVAIDDLRARVEQLTQVVAVVPELQEAVRTQGEAIRGIARQLTRQGQRVTDG